MRVRLVPVSSIQFCRDVTGIECDDVELATFNLNEVIFVFTDGERSSLQVEWFCNDDMTATATGACVIATGACVIATGACVIATGACVIAQLTSSRHVLFYLVHSNHRIPYRGE